MSTAAEQHTHEVSYTWDMKTGAGTQKRGRCALAWVAVALIGGALSSAEVAAADLSVTGLSATLHGVRASGRARRHGRS